MLIALWRDRTFQSISLTILLVTFSVAGVEVFASSAISDGRGFFGAILYVRPEQADRAAQVLQV